MRFLKSLIGIIVESAKLIEEGAELTQQCLSELNQDISLLKDETYVKSVTFRIKEYSSFFESRNHQTPKHHSTLKSFYRELHIFFSVLIKLINHIKTHPKTLHSLSLKIKKEITKLTNDEFIIKLFKNYHAPFSQAGIIKILNEYYIEKETHEIDSDLRESGVLPTLKISNEKLNQLIIDLRI